MVLFQDSVFANNYKDIENHWAKDNIVEAIRLGIISGDENQNIKPNDNVSRIEYIRIINKAFGFEFRGHNQSSFRDVGSGNWYDEDIYTAEEYGYLKNVYNNNLEPNRQITRQEAAIILSQARSTKKNIDNYKSRGHEINSEVLDAIKFVSENNEIKYSNLLNRNDLKFSDANEINENYLNAVNTLSNEKIINGYLDNTFRPNAPIKRAEAIIIILKSTGNAVEINKVKAVPEEKLEKVEKIEEKKSEVKVQKQEVNSKLKLEKINDKYFVINKETFEKVNGSEFEGGLVRTSDNSYLVNSSGEVEKGFLQVGNKIYYADKENGLVRGFREINGSLFYFSPLDNHMYANGVFSTGREVHWFDKYGRLKTGYRPAGYMGKKNINWKYPSKEELSNSWLEGDNKELRFRGQEIANYAAKYEGLPFKWYGCDLKDKSGIYCCGAVYSAYKDFGIHVPGPNDCNMYNLGGYEMVKAQYTRAKEFGGEYLPADYSKIYPGDIAFFYSLKMTSGYNHAAIFMVYNGNSPIIVHATLANGLVVEDANICTSSWGYKYLKFVRFNTEKNKGIGNIVPE